MANDQFGTIAQNFVAKREELFTPAPPVLPEIALPNQQSDPEAEFVPPHRMTTQSELEEELARKRQAMKPYLAHLEPAIPVRPAITLKEHFQWRVEPEGDRNTNLAEALQGGGAWQEVTLPHYAGPIGYALTSYRTAFQAEPAKKDETVWLCFGGVDYRCEVYVNGLFAGCHEGFFEPFEFEVGKLLQKGENTLVIRVQNEASPTGVNEEWNMPTAYNGDKLYACTGPGWDDPAVGWHHCPPGMGILTPIKLERRPRTFLRDLFIRPLADRKSVEAWVEVYCSDPEKQAIELELAFFGSNYKAKLAKIVEKPADLAMRKNNRYRFTVELPGVRTWTTDTPWMNTLQVTLKNNGDVIARDFGMRTFTMDAEHKPYGRLYLNDEPIRLRGANTMGFEQQDVMRGDFDQLVDDILLARIANLNFWRITQRPVQSEVYDHCDRLGLLIQCDFPLFGILPRFQFAEAVRQAGAMERLIRNHPCVVIATFINEPYPPHMTPPYRQLARHELEWFFSAASVQIMVENPDRVLKPVDGDYDPPAPGICDIHCYNCWYNGHAADFGQFLRGYWTPVKPDWYLGCGEYGVEGLDPLDLMLRRYPREWLPVTPEEEQTWSPNAIVRAQSGQYSGMFYERPRSLKDWVDTSRDYQRWGVGTMTQIFRRDDRFVTFAMHLFIDAWPSGWMKTVMDCERQAKPAFFALRDALAPLKADIRTDRTRFFSGETMQFEFRVLNDPNILPEKPVIRWQLKSKDKCLFAGKAPAQVDCNCGTFQGYFRYPAPTVAKRTAGTLELALEVDGKLLNSETVDLEFFPAVKPLAGVRVIPLGTRSRKLAAALGATVVASDGTYLIDDYAEFDRRRAEVEAAAAKGAKVVFHELGKGEYCIAGKKIVIEEVVMNPRHFLSRDTGHVLVAGFGPTDFRHWFSAEADCVVPLAECCFRQPDFAPVLNTVTEVAKEWIPAMAAGTCGQYFVSTVRLADTVAFNPAAWHFAAGVLS